MERHPKNLFCPAWAITLNGRIIELRITEACSNKILANDAIQYFNFTYDKEKEIWEDRSLILVFDLQCDETQQLINNRLTKHTQNVESSYIEAVQKYRDSKKEIESIRSNNAEIIVKNETGNKIQR